MIDLTRVSRVFKGNDKTVTKPEISAVVVLSQSTPELQEAVRKSIADAGFKTDVITKADDDKVMVYKQCDSSKDQVLVRLSENVAVVVKGFGGYLCPDEGTFEDLAKANGFYSGINGSLDAFYSKACDILNDTESPAEAASNVKALISEFGDYISNLVSGLPEAAFKMDNAIEAALPKETPVEVKKDDVAQTTLNGINEALTQSPKSYTGATPWDQMSTVDRVKWMKDWFESNAGTAGPGNNEDTLAAPPQGGVENKTGTSVVKTDEVLDADGKPKKKDTADLAPTGTEAGKGGTTEKVIKDEQFEKLMAAINGVSEGLKVVKGEVEAVKTQVTAVSAEVTEVKKSHSENTIVVDELKKKSETLESKLATTVVAPAISGDRPAGTAAVTKSEDDDPRTGCFDTAFLRKKRN